jgi:hypothetical protein
MIPKTMVIKKLPWNSGGNPDNGLNVNCLPYRKCPETYRCYRAFFLKVCPVLIKMRESNIICWNDALAIFLLLLKLAYAKNDRLKGSTP